MKRADHWTPVAPGHVIPAGQPYRVEPESPTPTSEFPAGHPADWHASTYPPVFVDSSWRPPIELPTEPTWGIVCLRDSDEVFPQWTRRWRLTGDGRRFRTDDALTPPHTLDVALVADFIPLTDEQVARIEAAR